MLFWLGFAVAVLPILWIVVRGPLHWVTLPFFAATGYVVAAYLSEQVGRWSDRSIGSRQASIVDTRPIKEVRRDYGHRHRSNHRSTGRRAGRDAQELTSAAALPAVSARREPEVRRRQR